MSVFVCKVLSVEGHAHAFLWILNQMKSLALASLGPYSILIWFRNVFWKVASMCISNFISMTIHCFAAAHLLNDDTRLYLTHVTQKREFHKSETVHYTSLCFLVNKYSVIKFWWFRQFWINFICWLQCEMFPLGVFLVESASKEKCSQWGLWFCSVTETLLHDELFSQFFFTSTLLGSQQRDVRQASRNPDS